MKKLTLLMLAVMLALTTFAQVPEMGTMRNGVWESFKSKDLREAKSRITKVVYIGTKTNNIATKQIRGSAAQTRAANNAYSNFHNAVSKSTSSIYRRTPTTTAKTINVNFNNQPRTTTTTTRRYGNTTTTTRTTW